MSNPTSNFGWQMPTPTDLVTDLPADFEVFGQAVDTSMADLKGGTTGQILSKATNADMDFTWIANDQGDITGITATSPLTGGGTSGDVTVGIQASSTTQSGAVQLEDSTSSTSTTKAATPNSVKTSYDLANAAIPKSLVDAKGDVLTATADNTPARLAVGANETRLVADSVQATGLKYVADTTNYAINAKGDLLAGTAADTLTALSVGTNGQTLVADSSTATGLKWAAASSGAMTLISRTTFSDVASQTFDGVFTTTYENYIVYFNSMSASTSADDPYLALRYAATDVAGSVYFNRMAMSSGTSTVTGSAQSGANFINMAAATGSSTEPGYGVMYFGNVGNVANKGNGWGQWNDGANGQASWFNGSFASGAAANKICTGFKVYSSSSNVSGTVTIYGLAKA